MANNGRNRNTAGNLVHFTPGSPAALSTTGIKSAVTLTASAQDVTSLTQPDVPRVVDIVGNVASTVAATLSTALAGANNDLDYTSVLTGVLGNAITIAYVDPADNDIAESVAVVGTAITFTLSTDGSSVITSTGDSLKATLLASAPASALVTAADKAANDGSGVVIAMAATALTGGITKSTGDVVITGRNVRGAEITDTIALNGTVRVLGTKAFASISNINFPARQQVSDTVAVGTIDKLGFPSTLRQNTVLKTFLNDVLEGTAPTVSVDADEVEKNLFDLNSALDGTRVDIWYMI
jgi:hypothetical protein